MNKNIVFFTLIVFTLISFVSGGLLVPKISKYFEITRPSNNNIAFKEKPLEKYSIENLSIKNINPSKITIENKIESTDRFESYMFSLEFDPSLDGKSNKKVSGMINIPIDTNTKFPIIVMLRGYVDQKIYVTGVGTKSAARYFADNGYITISPDFLGYGNSDSESGNIFESRFQTYVTVLSLIKSLGSVQNWNGRDILIWGHSNGGQIALTTLEITEASYPTTLWAPVSKPFPYSVLYYTDESEDKGKFIRKELAIFEEDYDVDKYSIDSYFDKIKATIQIHQGTFDDAIPVEWTKNLYDTLMSHDIDVALFLYSGADHNLKPSWDTVVKRDLEFFNKNLQN